MKSVSKLALAFAFASLPMTSAFAADDAAKAEKPKKEKKGAKEKAPEAKKLALSKEFQAAYNPVVQAYVKKKDATTAAVAKEAWPKIKAAVMNEDDRYQAALLAQDIAAVLNDKPLRNEAIDLLMASTSTPADLKKSAIYVKGAVAYESNDYPAAVTYLTQAYDQGYRQNSVPGGLEILVADSYNQQGKTADALAWMERSLEGSKVAGAAALPVNFYAKGANFALKTKDYKIIHPWMVRLVQANPKPDYWQDALSNTYRFAVADSNDALDLMRLMRAVGAMKYEQNYRAYAEDTMIARVPLEVKAVLEEGFASKTITKENATYKGLYQQVLDKLAADPFSLAQLDKDIAAAKTGAELAFNGDTALSVGEYAKAKAAYEAALAKGGIVDREGKDLSDRTELRLGIAKVKLGDLAGAKAEFAKVTGDKRKSVADFWQIYVDQLAKAAPAAPAAG
jgi:hypothetical protein